jgi:hypothetical protein
MIKTLEIKNFKSIKHLKLECKRVNLFIGKPNTGKSNILESVGIFSLSYTHGNLNEIVRFENMTNLFHDQDVNEKIEITADAASLTVKFENGKFKVSGDDKEKKVGFNFHLDYDGKVVATGLQNSPIKFYKFEVMHTFTSQQADLLLPVRGENLLQILLTNKDLRKVAATLFSEYGLRVVLKPQDNKIELQKEIDDVIVSYPYALVSDTLQRAVFHLAAMETNKDSTIIFEEPEAHAFPYYTKFLGERIAFDESNQYFVSTHNPYFLLSILEKTPKDDIGIFITYFKEYQTQLRPLAEAEFSEILDLDASVFFNLGHFLGEV